MVVLAAGTIGFHRTLHESWLQSLYRTVVTTSLAGLDTVPRTSGAQADLDRARARRADYLCLRRDDPRRGDRRWSLHGRAGRAKEAAEDRTAERALPHLRLRPCRPARRARVPALRRPVRRARLQHGRDRARARAEHSFHRGERHRGRGPARGRARARARPDRVLRLRRGQPLHHALRAFGAARSADRRASLRRGRGSQASAGGGRPRRPAVRDRGQGDGEPRPAPAGGGVPRHRHVGRRPGAPVRGDQGDRRVLLRPGNRSATCACAARPAR